MRYVTTVASVLALTAALSAQNPSAAPTFEVASVKRNTGEPGPPVFDGSAFRQSGRLTVMNATVLMLLQVLYRDERPVDIQGGPSWIATDRFDIAAVGEPQSDAEVAPGRTLPRLSAMPECRRCSGRTDGPQCLVQT